MHQGVADQEHSDSQARQTEKGPRDGVSARSLPFRRPSQSFSAEQHRCRRYQERSPHEEQRVGEHGQHAGDEAGQSGTVASFP
jgi:hypothetical protein